MEFIVKKTFELSQIEKQQIVDLFNAIFEKSRDVNMFDEQFINNSLGYSYHALMIDNTRIVGCNSYVPNYYVINGDKRVFCNSMDTMVSKPYRDFVNFYDMIIAAYDYIAKDGVFLIYGFPNDNSYFVYNRSKLMFDIGKLHTYCLPYRVGGMKPELKLFNPLSIIFSRLLVSFSSLFSSKKIYSFPIEKEQKTYNISRYKWFGGDYEIIDKSELYFTYKVKLHEGVRTAFLIDVMPKSSKNFNKAVKYIVKKEGTNFDLMLYIGNLPFKNSSFMKIPRKYEPKNFNFTCKILNEKGIDKDMIFDIQNWDVNLSNYDLI